VIDLSLIFKDSKKYFPIEEPIVLTTYVKPFSALASSFQHVLLMDADVYFLKNPSNLFNFNDYLNKNILLFGDRTIWPNEKRHIYYKSIMPEPYSDKFRKSRLIRGISGHETESGVVLINKGDQRSYIALLTICMLNTRCYRRHIVRNGDEDGDKETFWIAVEMLQVPYHKIDQVGALGNIHEKQNMVCGQYLHGDDFDNPLWWNGGFHWSKDGRNSPWTIFKSYVWDVEQKSSLWVWPCLIVSSQKIYNLTDEQLQLIQTYKKYNCTTFDC
jgi:hypothetical protein